MFVGARVPVRARTNPSLNKSGWIVRMWNIPMLDGRPKSTDYYTGVSDVRESPINLVVGLIRGIRLLLTQERDKKPALDQ